MEIAFIGHGRVGGALADHLRRLGHDVVIASDAPDSPGVRAALARNAGLRTAPVTDAVAGARVVFLATPFAAAAGVVEPLAEALDGRVLVDCTNPVGPGLTHGLGSAEAGSQMLQRLAPGASVVKAFSVYGSEDLEDNRFPGADVLPAMFFCGDDPAAKATVGDLVAQLGWHPLDVGGLEQALHLEHMTLLWVRMVRAGGRSPHLAWAALER